MNTSLERWAERQTICVTGGRGALGTRLIRRLVAIGARRVVGLGHRPPSAAPTEPHPCAEHHTGNILSVADLDRAFEGCTVVFHLAGQAHTASSSNQAQCFEVNAAGTAQVVAACLRRGIRQLVYVSTAYVYGIPRRVPVGEDHPTFPTSVYASSKLLGEVAARETFAESEVSCDIARLANVYGASWSADTVVDSSLRQAAASDAIRLFDLTPIRDFVYAEDAIEALVRLAATGEQHTGCRVTNVSTGTGTSVRKMAETVAQLVMDGGLGYREVVQIGPDRPEVIPELILDNSRLRAVTGWSPPTSLAQGLRLAFGERSATLAMLR